MEDDEPDDRPVLRMQNAPMLVRDVFDLGEPQLTATGDRLSAIEKRKLQGDNSAVAKARTATRQRERSRRDAQKNAFLDDGA